MIKFLLTITVLIMHNSSFANKEISNLITPVSYFVDHVKQLRLLKNNLSKYLQTSLVGVSGIGKTQAARIYAYENRDNYDLIWFIDCNLDINTEFIKLAKQLNITLKTNIAEDIMSAKEEVISYLVNKDKWLLVFDNLKVGENKKVQEFIDWEHNGNIIFCSQDSEILPYTIEMTTFNNEDAVTLANNLLESKDEDDITFLAKAFSGYPILIVQGAQLLNKIKGLNKEEYKNKIHNSADKINLNVTLAIKELKPSAIKLLNMIALTNNQGFSKQLLSIITHNSSTLDDDIYQLSKFILMVLSHLLRVIFKPAITALKNIRMPLYISPKLLKYFKGFCSSSEIIMLFVYMKCRFSLSYRDLEEMASIRGAKIDHATLQRWVIKFVPLIDTAVRKRKKSVGNSWRMDETYIKINGVWVYLYRAVDSLGNTIEFLLRKHRDAAAAKAFFRKAFKHNDRPKKAAIDKSGSNISALKAANKELAEDKQIEVRQVKYLNNIVEQDHRFIKKRTKPMLGFKSFRSAKITITGIENIRIIQKGQLTCSNNNLSTFENFKMLMAS